MGCRLGGIRARRRQSCGCVRRVSACRRAAVVVARRARTVHAATERLCSAQQRRAAADLGGMVPRDAHHAAGEMRAASGRRGPRPICAFTRLRAGVPQTRIECQVFLTPAALVIRWLNAGFVVKQRSISRHEVEPAFSLFLSLPLSHAPCTSMCVHV
jgi:hypothetical protein